MRLNDDEAELVRASFRALSLDGPGTAACFYRHLFAFAPETEELFVADIASQGVKLMSTLSVVATQIQTWTLLAPTLDQMAVRHLAYGVRPEHYPPVGRALQATLLERLGETWTPEIAAAWHKAYGNVARTMIDAAYASRLADQAP